MTRCPRHAPHGALVRASAHAHPPVLAEDLLNPEVEELHGIPAMLWFKEPETSTSCQMKKARV